MKTPIADTPDPIATLRRYLPLLPTSAARDTVAKAIDALEAERTALRSQCNRLAGVLGNIDAALDELGDDAKWVLNPADSAAFAKAMLDPPEPNDALKAAAERTKEHGENP